MKLPTSLEKIDSRGFETYGRDADEYIRRYESVSFDEVHAGILDLFPAKPSLILDIGAGSGRDAAALARMGHTVYAVEPSDALRSRARLIHLEPGIRWVDDSLPDLREVKALGLSFVFVLLSAVWMHVAPGHRRAAFDSVVRLVQPGGRVAFVLRIGHVDDARRMYPVSAKELRFLGGRHALKVVRTAGREDRLRRPDLSWISLVLEKPF